MTGHDLYSYVRERISLILIGGGALSVAFAPTDYVLYVMLFWAAITVYLALGAQIRTRRAARRFGGKILEFVFAPTPINSLFESLSKHGVAAESIATIDLMSVDLKESLDYYEHGHENGRGTFFSKIRKSPDMKVTIYGQSKTEVQGPPYLSLVSTRDRHVEHINLLTTKDRRNFVWFEPYHNVVKGKHYFTRGAYLLEVMPDRAASVKKMLDELPRAA